MTESAPVTETAKPASQWSKRNVTAIVVSTVVGVALSAVSSAYVGKLSEQIKTRIAPPQTTESE